MDPTFPPADVSAPLLKPQKPVVKHLSEDEDTTITPGHRRKALLSNGCRGDEPNYTVERFSPTGVHAMCASLSCHHRYVGIQFVPSWFTGETDTQRVSSQTSIRHNQTPGQGACSVQLLSVQILVQYTAIVTSPTLQILHLYLEPLAHRP